jgi:predicted enzyme related to lactoylglutathione lyase
MNPVVHFEIPADDQKKSAAFYANVFGWKAEQLGESHNHYVVVKTTEGDAQGCPKEPGRINGGIYKKKEEYPKQYPSVVIAVENLQAHMKKVNEAGGKALGEPWDIPGVGLYVSFLDPEGNRLSMLQPKMPK